MLATCGVRTTRGWRQSGWSAGGGSCASTSRIAEARCPRVERRQQIRLDEVAAAPDVDQPSARRQSGEERGVEDAARVVREG